MRVAQTSLIVFVSKVVASAFGFISTVYFARMLGAKLLGIYVLTLTIVAWLQLGSTIGVGGAMRKRISEDQDPEAYFAAGCLSIGVLSLIIVGGIFITREYIISYIGGSGEHVANSIIWFIAGLFLLESGTSVINNTLKGRHKVHIYGLTQPLKIGTRSVIQIGLVSLGLGILGLFIGKIISVTIVIIIGFLFINIRVTTPSRKQIRGLFDYAKFSWLGNLQSRVFNDVDLLILGWLASTRLVGVYSVVWSITKFLDIFGVTVSEAIFPEISRVSSQENREAAIELVEDAITYAGFVTIPGFFGGAILSERLLRIYGVNFIIGTEVMWLLLLSILIYSYLQQLMNVLNALDRPDLAFSINIALIILNFLFNIALVWHIGWVGAAVASLISSLVCVLIAYFLLIQIISVRFPKIEIAKQLVSAVLMAGVVLFAQETIQNINSIKHNITIVLILVTLGSVVYICILLIISRQFRVIIDRNLHFDLPLC